MATTTWQGDESASWGTAGNWDTGSVPTAADDVVLSNSAACTISSNAVCRSLNASSYTGTLTHNASVSITIGDGTAGAGNVALAFNTTANMTYTLGSGTTSSISFISTSATVQTINFNGHNTGNVTFNASSNGSWKLTGTWGSASVNASQETNLTKGTLDTNGQTCYWGVINASNSNVRSLTLGTSTINLLRASAVGWYTPITTNLTFSAANSVIILSGTSAQIYAGALTYGEVRWTGAGAATIDSSSNNASFGILTRTGTGVKTDSLSIACNITVTGTLNIDGNSAINRVLVTSNTLGTARTLTLTGATISGCSNVDFRDITFANGGSNVDFSSITGGSGDCGGNTISGGGTLSFTTADDWYWNGSGTQVFSDYTYWYTATNGGGSQMASTRCPLPQDTCYINGDSIDGATTIDQDMPRVCKTLDFTGCAAMAFHTDNIAQTIYGSLILDDNVTLTSSSSTTSLTFEGRSDFTCDLSGKSWASPVNINMIPPGTLTLTADFTSTSDSRLFKLNNGTLDADIYNFTFGAFDSSNSNARTLLMGSGTWTIKAGATSPWNMATVTNLTDTSVGETSTISFTNVTGNYIFAGGGCTYNNWETPTSTGIVTISGSNTFNTLTINAPKTVKFTAGTTTTVSSFVATGSSGNLIHIASTTTTAATLSDASGTNQVYYCHIGDDGTNLDRPVNATGGATWLAYTSDSNEVNTSTGWITAVVGAVRGFMTCMKGIW